jgi:preprotein translocase subunit SecG
VLNNPRIPEGMHEDILERMEGRFTAARMTRTTLVFGVIFNAIIGLILAAFIKKNQPENPVA